MALFFSSIDGLGWIFRDLAVAVGFLFRTEKSGGGAEGHDDGGDEQVGGGQRYEEPVGDVLQRPFQSHGQADEHVTHRAGHNEHQHRHERPVEAAVGASCERFQRFHFGFAWGDSLRQS